MAPLINAQEISKTYGVNALFQDLVFTVSEDDRIGVIGPNGAGKSTLLQILAGRVDPDTGIVIVRKRARLSYVAQHSEFGAGQTVRAVLEASMNRSDVTESDHQALLAETAGRAGFTDLDVEAVSLSGGWRKRLAIVEGLVQMPDVLLLDEPTNHLDIAGIRWLETILQSGRFASVVVSHDRYLLENVASSIVEINRLYADGMLRVPGNYSEFLEARQEYLDAQGRRRESLANRVRTEIEWLRRGPKARGTKAKARIQNAEQLIDELGDLQSRGRMNTATIDFSSTDRRTKHLLELEEIKYSIGGRTLFTGLQLILKPGMRVGIVGPNGSGKTTLLRIIRGELQPDGGVIRRADQLRIVYFDQARELDPQVTLKRALAPDSDSVVFQDRVIHVAAWADRFLFSNESLNQPIAKLSGGERARVLIAQLMLQSADVLLLDEPTNDLDIPTLEVLEQSLLEFRGAVLLVTHDRYLMDRVATSIIGLDGFGHAERFADYAQWTDWQQAQEAQDTKTRKESQAAAPSPLRAVPFKKKLSYIEAREYATIEERISEAEQVLQTKRDALNDPAIASDAAQLVALSAQIQEAEHALEALYARWAELEDKM